MKNIKLVAIIFSIITLFFCMDNVSAASLYFSNESNEIKKDDVFVVNVKMSSLNQKINVAEGSLYFNNEILQVIGVSTGGSIFSLWTRSPVFSNDNGAIIFAGGIPNGFEGESGELFKIIFLAKEAGKADVSFSDSSVLYLNDGNGTKIEPDKERLNIDVSNKLQNEPHKDAWSDILVNDKTPPENLDVKLAKDPFTFNGQFFIAFSAYDKDSGITSYAVKEGSGDFIQSESPYVLKDQSLRSSVFVKAVDKSGNYVIMKLQKPIYLSWLFWMAISSLLIVSVCILKRKYVKK